MTVHTTPRQAMIAALTAIAHNDYESAQAILGELDADGKTEAFGGLAGITLALIDGQALGLGLDAERVRDFYTQGVGAIQAASP